MVVSETVLLVWFWK